MAANVSSTTVKLIPRWLLTFPSCTSSVSYTHLDVYKRQPQRYTLEFMEKYDEFTLSFFDGEYKKELGICGAKSGRDIAVSYTHLTPASVCITSARSSPAQNTPADL